MSSRPSSSQGTTRNTHEPPPPANNRYLIHVAADGTVGGRDVEKWSSRCGALIRAHVPIHYTDWRLIPKNFKDDVWTALMEKANPGEPVKRSTVWKMARTSKKTGEVLPSAKEAFEQIEAVEGKRKAACSSQQDSTTTMDDIEHDELAEVFGLDIKDRCRAMSSTSSVKKVKHGKAAKALAEQACDAKFSEFKKEIQDQVKSAVNELKEAAAAIFHGISQLGRPQSYEGTTPRTEGASNTGKEEQIRPQKLNQAFDALATPSTQRDPSQSEKQYVMLLSRERTEVAKGYIHNHSGVCHMKKVEDFERVVYVTEVKDPEAKIYEAPQMGNYKLCEMADGGFLIWLQSRLWYL